MDARSVRLRRAAIGTAVVVVLGFGAWQGAEWLGEGRAAQPAANETATNVAEPVPEAAPSPAVVKDVSKGAAAADASAGNTPMGERVAVVGFLNKRNGNSRDITMKPGEAVRIGDAIIRLRACDKTAPWEQDQLTGAFLQLDIHGADRKWRRVFSGWTYAERPSLNVVQSPLYDVWAKSCTMSFPATGPDTVTLSSDARRSSAAKSPSTQGEPDASPPTDAPSAESSNTE